MAYCKVKAIKLRFRSEGRQITPAAIMAIEKKVSDLIEELYNKTASKKRVSDEDING